MRAARLTGGWLLVAGFLAALSFSGSGVAAEDSDWTVIVAKEIRLQTTATIRINADYASSDVPVPNGVGPNAGGMGGERTQLVN